MLIEAHRFHQISFPRFAIKAWFEAWQQENLAESLVSLILWTIKIQWSRAGRQKAHKDGAGALPEISSGNTSSRPRLP